FINFYIVLAPPAIASGALPGKAGHPLVRMWFHGFISVVMVQFLQLVAILTCEMMLNSMYQALLGQDGHIAQTLQDILGISILWFVLRIPNLLGTAPMRTLSEAGQAMQQVAATSIAVGVAEAQVGVQAVGGLLEAGAIFAA